MDRSLRLALTLLGVACFAASAFVSPDFALMTAPVCFLLLALFNGLRPGEALIERYRRASTTPRLARGRAARPRPPRPVHRPGRLIASGLAMRPPPVASSSAC